MPVSYVFQSFLKFHFFRTIREDRPLYRGASFLASGEKTPNMKSWDIAAFPWGRLTVGLKPILQMELNLECSKNGHHKSLISWWPDNHNLIP
jgi:hypothetical protein